MGNFEKLGILVIIVLVVVIIVVAAWGVRGDPTAEAPLVATNLDSDETRDDVDPDDGGRGDRRGGTSDDVDPDDGRGGDPDDDGRGRVDPPPPVRDDPPVRPKRFHVVKSGDNPWKLADRYYGKGHLWKIIEKANPSVDFDTLSIGDKLLIPYRDGDAQAAPRRRTNEAAVAGGRTYVIKDGDTLWDIAKDQLGDPTRHPEILAANPNLSEHRLREGTKIRLPAR